MRTSSNSAFEIISRIGCGGSVEAFIVRSPLAAENLVGLRLKVEGLSKRAREEALARFVRQYTQSQILGNHPSRVFPTTYGFAPDAVSAWILIEAFEADLGRRCAGDAIGWQNAAELLAAPLRALAILHRRGLFHRDVKPQNMLCRRSRVALADLGIVGAPSLLTPYTPPGIVQGTLLYLHPGVFQKKPDDALLRRADLYAWYVSWFELAHGMLPAWIENEGLCMVHVVSGAFLQYLLRHTPEGLRPDLTDLFESPRPRLPVTASRIAAILSEHFPALNASHTSGTHLRAILPNARSSIRKAVYG